MELIHGAKGGGGGGHTPTESPDSLLSESTAKILLAISEGEIAGGLDDTRIFLMIHRLAMRTVLRILRVSLGNLDRVVNTKNTFRVSHQ